MTLLVLKPTYKPLSPLSIHSPLHTSSALEPLLFQLASEPRCDPQFSASPQMVHFTREVSSKLGWVDYKQSFIISVSGRMAPIKWYCDHCFVVDHGELVVDDVECVSWIGISGLFRSDKSYLSQSCEWGWIEHWMSCKKLLCAVDGVGFWGDQH